MVRHKHVLLLLLNELELGAYDSRLLGNRRLILTIYTHIDSSFSFLWPTSRVALALNLLKGISNSMRSVNGNCS